MFDKDEDAIRRRRKRFLEASGSDIKHRMQAGGGDNPMPKAVPRRSIRDVQKEYTKELLVRSAHDFFVKNGYVNTTIDQIAARAGTSRATFYLHFQRKWETVRHIA